MESIKAKIEDLISQNATDFEIAKIIRDDLERYYKTLPELFLKSSGREFLFKHTRKDWIRLLFKLGSY